MPELPARKVGIVACSGEELAEGTVTRLAALKVLNELRPRDTVTICLPLFLAGGSGDRAFARVHPTITVDGCDLRCAARATEKYSSKPAASLVVNELVAECELEKPAGRRRLNKAGQQAVEVTAERLASLVDRVLSKEGRAPSTEDSEAARATRKTSEATCSCGSGISVTKLDIGGRAVEMVALPLIFQKFRDIGRSLDDAAARELFETVKIYNAVPAEAEESYRQAILNDYATYCRQEKKA
ncbi:MAG: putative zinc-binding protein [Candidatus Omnitrophica bacterium]|nr:putative zinc-binding protein [Candidatus Omnitrophota bacterium]